MLNNIMNSQKTLIAFSDTQLKHLCPDGWTRDLQLSHRWASAVRCMRLHYS